MCSRLQIQFFSLSNLQPKIQNNQIKKCLDLDPMTYILFSSADHVPQSHTPDPISISNSHKVFYKIILDQKYLRF